MTNNFGKIAIVVLVLSLLFGAVSLVVKAHEGVEDETGLEITFEDLGLNEPKLLPGEPLYFLKNWQRGIRRLFSFGASKDAYLETEIMNELAAEIKALEEKGSEKGLTLALQNYKENAERLRQKISSLNETSGNENVERLLNSLMDRIIKHEEIFGELEGITGVKEELSSAKTELEMAVGEAVTKLDSADNFKTRVEGILSGLKDNPLKELRVIYVLNYIEEKVPEDIRNKIRELETDLTTGFEGRFKAEPGEVVPHLDFLPVKNATDLGIFDQIRERISDGDLKSELNIIRQNALRDSNGDMVEEESLTNLIYEAEKVTAELKTRISSDEYISSKTVAEILERAEFHLTQAGSLLGEGQLATAFGQATAAQAAAENGLSQLRLKEEIKEDNLSLRIQFDDLVNVAKTKNLIREAAPEIYEFFDRAERTILEADTASEIKNAKIMLAELEVLIVNNR
ncbi:MAG: DUF5667 domain-containing protein [Candidatus Jorgensenbacteria bacterium]